MQPSKFISLMKRKVVAMNLQPSVHKKIMSIMDEIYEWQKENLIQKKVYHKSNEIRYNLKEELIKVKKELAKKNECLRIGLRRIEKANGFMESEGETQCEH